MTAILQSIAGGDRQASARLLPLVYNELRQLAKMYLGKLPPGQTLQPTALVHEAYLKLVDSADRGWDNRAHFFHAAARAMREILVDQARRKAAIKHGGDRQRVEADPPSEVPLESPAEDILALNSALQRLEQDDPRKAQIVMLRYFAGLSREDISHLLGITTRTVDREWRYIVARLHRDMSVSASGP